MLREAYLDAAAVAVDLLSDPPLARCWDDDSVLPGFSVSGLSGHLARQVILTRRIVDDAPGVDRPISLMEHFARSEWNQTARLDDTVHVEIRRRGEDTAGVGPKSLVRSTAEALSWLRGDLPTQPADRVVELRGQWCLLLDDFLVSRLLELVIHVDDLALSIGAAPPAMPPTAVDPVLQLLMGLALQRHGATAVLRALSRQERAPQSIAAI